MQALVTSFAQQQVDPISGGAGWVGAGLLGAVLAWLLLVDMPARRKEIRELIADQAAEHRADRESRHELAGVFTRAIADQLKAHDEDAKRDREAFEHRQDRMERALALQTQELRMAIAQAGCGYTGQRQQPPPTTPQ